MYHFWKGGNGSFTDPNMWAVGGVPVNNSQDVVILDSGIIDVSSFLNGYSIYLDGSPPYTNNLELYSGSMFGSSLSVRLGGDYLNTNQFDTTHSSELQLAPGELNFYDYGTISVESVQGGASNSLVINLSTSAGSVFVNYGNIYLYGFGTYSNGTNLGNATLQFWGEGGSTGGVATTPYLGTLDNTGTITVGGSGAVFFATAPMIGNGTMNVSGGGLIKFDAPVATGETVNINNAALEFGAKGSIAKPALQFMSRIDFTGQTGTVVLDGLTAANLLLSVHSTANGGSADLKIFDNSRNVIADFQLQGHYQQSEFAVSSGGGASELSFYSQTLSPLTLHS